jgi:hypothetical protein
MPEATLTPSAGSSSESAPASTAASGSPSATPTPSERPTFAQAFASDAASPTTSTTQPEGATTQPVAESAPTGETPNPSTEGPIPFAVHKQSLDNARAKERQAVETHYQGLTTQLQAWTPIAQRMVEDPIGFMRDYTAELAQRDPTLATQVRSEAARTLGARQPQGPPPPDVQIVNERGEVTGSTYSEKGLQAYAAWRDQQLLAKMQQEFAPFKHERDQRIQNEQQRQLTAQVESAADSVMAEVSEILDIGDLGKLTPDEQGLLSEVAAQMETGLSAHKAALAVRKAKIAPQAQQKAQAAVLDSLNKKAAANGVNPSGAAVSSTKRPTSFNDPSLKWN